MSNRQFTANPNPNLYVAQALVSNNLQVEVRLLPIIGWLVVESYADDEDWYSPPIPVTPCCDEPDCAIYDRGADVWVFQVNQSAGVGLDTLRKCFETDAEHRPEEYGLDAPLSVIRAKVIEMRS